MGLRSGAVLLLCWFAPALAVTVAPVDFSGLVAKAELIFTGKVVSTRSEWNGQGNERCIVTFVTFDVQGAHKGTPPSRLELRFLGGAMGDTSLEVAGMPKFQAGERSILFVEKDRTLFCPLVGVYHGKLTIEQDPATGQDILLGHNRRPLTDVREMGADEEPAIRAAGTPGPVGRPLTVAEFGGHIQRELKASRR